MYDVEVELTLKVKADISVEADDIKEAYSIAVEWVKDDIKESLFYGETDSVVTEVDVTNVYVSDCIFDANEDAHDR